MHVYTISYKSGTLEVHAVGKNIRMSHRHSRTTSSNSRPRPARRASTASETESVITSASELVKDESLGSTSGSQYNTALLTPSTSVPSTPSVMFPPPASYDRPSSRRSSFSGSNAPGSPATHTRYGRSPSPMPALPAIRPMMPNISTWSSVKLYGDENYTNFFRRLTFSPDGGLLLTPAGHFEDPSVIPGSSRSHEDIPTRGRKGRLSPPLEEGSGQSSSSCVYIYSRANFARPPIARLPGHKKPSVAVRFSPLLYDLRPGVGSETHPETKIVPVERGSDKSVDVDIVGPSPSLGPIQSPEVLPPLSPLKLSASTSGTAPIVAPTPRLAVPPSPALSATDSLRPPTPATSKPATPALTPTTPSMTSSIFALSYRMLYSVATMDTIAIHDTQQAGPVCLLTKLHYDEFTDMSWYALYISLFALSSMLTSDVI